MLWYLHIPQFSFVLGFYVSIVVTRWWQQFMQIPWPDKAVLLISGYVRGDDERGRIIRRTLARYLVLMQVLTFQAVSTSGKNHCVIVQDRTKIHLLLITIFVFLPRSTSSSSISYIGSYPRGRLVYSRRTYGLRWDNRNSRKVVGKCFKCISEGMPFWELSSLFHC